MASTITDTHKSYVVYPITNPRRTEEDIKIMYINQQHMEGSLSTAPALEG
jgi:hypothetical protein